MTIDELAGRLLDGRDQAARYPELKTEWAARGATYFRPNGGGNEHSKRGAANRAAGNGEHHDGHKPPAAQPSCARPTPPPATQDLLGGIAADRPGADTAAEGGGRGEQP